MAKTKKPGVKTVPGKHAADIDAHPPVRRHANRLRELRMKGCILSQRDVGKLIGADDSTVSRDESGEIGLSRERMVQYAQLYKVTTAELFVEPAAEEPAKAAS